MKSDDIMIILFIAAIINFGVMYYLIRVATDAQKQTQLLWKQFRILKLIARTNGATDDQIDQASDITQK